MTKIEFLENSDYELILNLMLSEKEIRSIRSDVKQFYKHSYPFGLDVKNVILMYAITQTISNNRTLNVVYLRKTAETFLNNNITNAAAALHYASNQIKNQEHIIEKQNMKENEPEWMDRYVDNLLRMD